MKINTFRLYFNQPLHISNSKADYAQSLRTVESDTMHAALLASLAKVGIPLPENGNAGFDISSLFPFYDPGGESVVYFLPKPPGTLVPPPQLLSNAKQIKKIRWLDTRYFSRLIHGENLLDEHFQWKDIQKEYLTGSKLPGMFITGEVTPRVSVPRTGILNGKKTDAEPFYMERLHFHPQAGLYFLATGDTDILKKALDILAAEGLGTDRTVGNGTFTWKEGEIELDFPESEFACCLSMFLPENHQLARQYLSVNTAGQPVAFSLRRRGGWITTPPYQSFRKNSVYMVETGSVIRLQEKTNQLQVRGRITTLNPPDPNASPPHPVWRNGRSLLVPVNFKK